jgi:O-antigen ligase
MLPIAVLLAVECALLAAIIILREPKLLIPVVVIGLPIEYFGTQALGTLGQSGIAGAVRALLNPGKAAMLATIVVGVVRLRHEPRRLVPNSAMLLPVTALLAVVILGVFWSDSLKAPNSVLIMPMYVAFVFVAPSLIENRRDVERIVGAFLLVCSALAVLALAQRVLGVFNWRSILVGSDGYSYRSNATFSDPNHLARYFALSMSLAIGLILATGPRRTTVYLAIPALVLAAAGIVATASRSGWGMLLLCTAVVVLSSPIARYTKAKLTLGSLATLVLMISLLFIQGGANAERVRSLASPLTALGQREFLIRVGWQMFLDNPLIGVGSGNYQHALIVSYRHLVPEWAEVTLSHTSMVSLLAELGLIGLFLFLFVCVRVTAGMVRTYFATTVHYNRLIVGWLGAGLLGIVFHSQSEGRLFDEPYLWLLLAIVVAIETGPAFARATEAHAEAPQRQPEAAPRQQRHTPRAAESPVVRPAGLD